MRGPRRGPLRPAVMPCLEEDSRAGQGPEGQGGRKGSGRPDGTAWHRSHLLSTPRVWSVFRTQIHGGGRGSRGEKGGQLRLSSSGRLSRLGTLSPAECPGRASGDRAGGQAKRQRTRFEGLPWPPLAAVPPGAGREGSPPEDKARRRSPLRGGDSGSAAARSRLRLEGAEGLQSFFVLEGLEHLLLPRPPPGNSRRIPPNGRRARACGPPLLSRGRGGAPPAEGVWRWAEPRAGTEGRTPPPPPRPLALADSRAPRHSPFTARLSLGGSPPGRAAHGAAPPTGPKRRVLPAAWNPRRGSFLAWPLSGFREASGPGSERLCPARAPGAWPRQRKLFPPQWLSMENYSLPSSSLHC
ncbi:myosin IC heavy chain-like [Sceloporus undulatus]|uniref:myosin IC heavy chain-like n=1 Tax=Sceloporus undulatus TaxID=8520 RepID=UPI001C4A9F77|nr:myosin IC heavy chain-like [Sceloporus undulatus]